MKHVLFLCTGNACRSQMAEAFARQLAPPGVRVSSAGTRPAGVDPRAVEVMREVGIDLTGHRSKHLDDLATDDVDLVVTLCADAAEACPHLAGELERLHWPLRDPAAAEGTAEAVRQVFREVRDEIAARVRSLFAVG